MTEMEILHRPHHAAAAPEQQLGPYGITSLIPRESELHFTAYLVKIEPHQTTSVSYHQLAEEIYFVIRGAGLALLNGKPYPLREGDFLRLPPGTRHGFVTGAEPLEMLDLHSPGSRPDRDVYFEGTPPAGFGTPPSC
jgi:quercetin dioxygenase-like cupin family protein